MSGRWQGCLWRKTGMVLSSALCAAWTTLALAQDDGADAAASVLDGAEEHAPASVTDEPVGDAAATKAAEETVPPTPTDQKAAADAAAASAKEAGRIETEAAAAAKVSRPSDAGQAGEGAGAAETARDAAKEAFSTVGAESAGTTTAADAQPAGTTTADEQSASTAAAADQTESEATDVTRDEANTVASSETAAEEDRTPPDQSLGKRIGSVKIHLGAGRPSFGSDLKYYKDLYGQPAFYPTVGLDYYFFNSAVTIGVGGQFSYYKANGKAAAARPVDGKVEKDSNSSTELTLVPLQLNLKAQFSPFWNRWIVLSGWLGYQWLFQQEVRFPPESDNTTTTTTSTTTASSTQDSTPTTYVNSGTNTEMVIGVGVSFRLDPLDQRSVSSLYPIGIRSVYLTPFMEMVKTMSNQVGKYDRTNLGLLFTFETIR